MSATSARTPMAFTFNVATQSSRSVSGASTGLMADMPSTPTREQRAIQPATPSSLPSPASQAPPSAASRLRDRWATLHSEGLGFLTVYTRPWITNKYTLLILTFMVMTFNLVSLYFTGFSLYLTHYLKATVTDPHTGDKVEGQCANFRLSAFLVFVVCRSLSELMLVGVRLYDNSLWVNAWAQLHLHQKAFIALRSMLYCLSLVFISFAVAWLAMTDPSQCVALGYEVAAGLTAFEALSVVFPFLFILPLSLFYHWRSLSLFAPFLPLTEDAFKVKPKGLTQAQISQLPSITYNPSLHTNDKCSVCITEFSAGESVRVLTCQHTFHAPCIDGWLANKSTCPLCVRTVETSKQRFSFHFSRTRRADSVTRAQSENELSQSRAASKHDDREIELSEHSNGNVDRSEQGSGPEVSIEIV